MTYVIAPAPVGLACDTDMILSDSALDALWTWGARVILTYAEVLSPAVLARYAGKRFGVGVLTYSRKNAWEPTADTGAADAKRALDAVHSLQVPMGLTILDDVEGPSPAGGPASIIAHVDAHAAAIAAAGDVAGDYIGWGTLLTSEEWQARPNVHAYYKAGGISRDRFNKAIEPARGWQIVQGLPFNRNVGGGIVDADFMSHDMRGSAFQAIFAEGLAPRAAEIAPGDLPFDPAGDTATAAG